MATAARVLAIDKVFADRLAAGHVRESTSPHVSPTFCVRKSAGAWRIAHVFNKLNAATVRDQTPIPRKDVIIDNMSRSTIFSSMDLMDGFYQILMREKVHSVHSSEHPERYALGVASNATRAE